ncbi:MAG TPA: DUF559 domain-containing protein [Acidimicrobiales bacterium]|nr:DUF559 domain-containing protein [Acidimicrobiales bacterium]
MRRLLTIEELTRHGVTRDARDEGWLRLSRGVYGEGKSPPTKMEVALAEVLATRGAACGRVAAALYGLEGVTVLGPQVVVTSSLGHRRPGVRRRKLKPGDIRLVGDFACTNPLVTMLDLASEVDDLVWEQALESALRKKLVTIEQIERALPGARGAERMRRVLALRPKGAPPTGSILETLMVQLARRIKGLQPPSRQVEIHRPSGTFVAFVDLAWPELGVFIELDGEGHKDQPVYDAVRQTAVTGCTGWLCGRFTWSDVVYRPANTARELQRLIDQARRRPLPTAS